MRTTFTCKTDETGVTCAIEAPDGDTTLIPHGRSWAIKLRAPRRPRAVVVDGDNAVDAGWRYESGFVHARVSASPVVMRVVW